MWLMLLSGKQKAVKLLQFNFYAVVLWNPHVLHTQTRIYIIFKYVGSLSADRQASYR